MCPAHSPLLGHKRILRTSNTTQAFRSKVITSQDVRTCINIHTTLSFFFFFLCSWYRASLKSLVNKSPTRCSLFHFVYFRSTCFGHGACPSSGVVCKNCSLTKSLLHLQIPDALTHTGGCLYSFCILLLMMDTHRVRNM